MKYRVIFRSGNNIVSCNRRFCIIFLISIFAFISNVKSQNLNRAYGNINYGYNRHFEFGLVSHCFNYFSGAFYLGQTTIPTGPIYHPGYGLFSGQQLKNSYSHKSLYLGIKTHSSFGIDLSIMGGITYLTYLEYYNIKKVPSYSAALSNIEFDKRQGNVFGGAIRGDLLITTGKFFGINISTQYSMNSIQNELNVVIGVSFGLVGDWKQE